MPTFDFQCRKCNHVFEHSRPFGSIELPACPACGSKRSEKLIAPPAVHFKGSGWYKTDSIAPAAKPAVKKEEKKSEDVKTEAKPAESKKMPAETQPAPSRAEGPSPPTKKAPDKKS